MTCTDACLPVPPPSKIRRAHPSPRSLAPVSSSADALRREVEDHCAFQHGNVLALGDDVLLFKETKRQEFATDPYDFAFHWKVLEQRVLEQRVLEQRVLEQRVLEQRVQQQRQLQRALQQQERHLQRTQQQVGERLRRQRMRQQQQRRADLAGLQRQQEQQEANRRDLKAAEMVLVQSYDDKETDHHDIIFTTFAAFMLAIMAIAAGYGLEHYRSLKPYVAFVGFAIVSLLYVLLRKRLSRA